MTAVKGVEYAECLQTCCGPCDPKWSCPEEVCGVCQVGRCAIALQNALFLRVLSSVWHAENVPAASIQERQIWTQCVPIKRLMGDPSPLCTQVVKFSRNCSLLCRTLLRYSQCAWGPAWFYLALEIDGQSACLWISNGSVTGIYGSYVGNVKVTGVWRRLL